MEWTWQEIIPALIGILGIVPNILALIRNCKKFQHDLPSKLYAVLNVMNFTICAVTAVRFLNDALDVAVRLFLNPFTAVWTCVICTTRLIALNNPFYRIKTRTFWIVSVPVSFAMPLGALYSVHCD